MDQQTQFPGRAVDDMLLAGLARHTYRVRRSRARWLPDELLGEPGWDMMLDLFISTVSGHRVSTTSLCIAGGVAPTTGLRWIATLERSGMVERSPSPDDGRVNEVRLTPDGYAAVRGCLADSLQEDLPPA
jgi:hypothetical protein